MDGLLPAYLLHGEDYSRAREFAEELRASAVPFDAEDLCFERFYLDETPWSEILDAVRTPPLFDLPWRLILVEEKAKRFPAKPSGSDRPAETGDISAGSDVDPDAPADDDVRLPGFSPADGEALTAYLASPLPRTTLAVLFKGTVLKSHPVMKAFSSANASAGIQEFLTPKGGSLKYWAGRKFAAVEKTPGPGTIDRLLDVVENDAGRLESEIEKLAVYVGDRRTIEEADVDQLSGGLKSADRYEITKALERGDAGAALKCLQRIFSDGAPEKNVRILIPMLANYLRDLLLARTLLLEGTSTREQVFAEVKPALYRKWPGSFRQQGETFFKMALNPDLPRFIAELERIDLLVKTTDLPPQPLLEAFVVGFARSGVEAGVTSGGRGRFSRPAG